MNGKFLLNTNAIVALLNGNKTIENELKTAVWVGISVIGELEFLAYSNLSDNDVQLFEAFKSRVNVIDVESAKKPLINTTLRLRKTYNIKLPDAIIAACALEEQATLISNDAVFPRINGLSLMTFQLTFPPQ